MWKAIPKERRKELIRLLKKKDVGSSTKYFAIKELFGIDATNNAEGGSCINLATKPYLVEALLDLNYPLPYQFLLIQGCCRGRFSLIKSLVEHKVVDLNAPYLGWYPLDLAIRHEDESIVKYLLDHGADPNTRSQYKEPVLSVAARFNLKEMVKLLMEAGADPFLKDNLYKKSTYDLAIQGKGSTYTMRKAIRKMIVDYAISFKKHKKKRKEVK